MVSLPDEALVNERDAQRILRMNASLEKYSAGLKPSSTLQSSQDPQAPKFVILTGSTGALGSYLLDNLISDPTVQQIYCLNRSATAIDRQHNGNQSRDLSTDFSRVRFLLADFSRPDFGLSSSIHSQLLHSVTHIIHNAWMINLKLPLSAFEATHVAGVRHMIDFSNASTHRADVIFTSTFGTALNWWGAGYTGPVPEIPHPDPLVNQQNGYCEAKWVAEQLLRRAGAICGTRSVILRVGQIAGPVRHEDMGCWNQSEYVPRLIRSSKYLGLVPRTLGTRNGGMDWTPIEVVADVVCEMLTRATTMPKNLHVVNPNVSTWENDIAPALQRSISQLDGKPDARIVSYPEWLSALKSSAQAANRDMVHNPALQLLSFYETLMQDREDEFDFKQPGNPRFVMTEVLAISKALRECGPVTGRWMEQWMRQWKREEIRKDALTSKLS